MAFSNSFALSMRTKEIVKLISFDFPTSPDYAT